MKHLGEAASYQEELPNYPSFLLRMVGCLSHAEMESMELYPELANEIRTFRLQVQDSKVPYLVAIPFDRWSEEIVAFKAASEVTIPVEEAPQNPS